MAAELSGKVLVEALNSGATLPSIVDPLVSHAQGGDGSRTLAGAINLCLQVAGADIEAEEAAFNVDADIPAVLEEIVARLTDVNCCSLLLSKDGRYKRLRRNFGVFFKSVVLSAYSFHVEDVVANLISWLIHMNESKVRSFRHVALMAACGVAEGLHDQHQLAASAAGSQRSRGGRGGGSVKAKTDVQLSEIFTHTMHNRIKDVSPEIRVAALQKLRQWFTAYPERYCENSYLVYLRFALYDKKCEMRVEALETIGQILCDVENGLAKLTPLLNKCIDRLTEMCRDVDTRTAHAAIKLCTVLVRCEFPVSHAQLDSIFEGLLDDRSIIRTTVGTFLKHFVAKSAKDASITPFNFIVALMETLEFQCPLLVEEYVIDSLWSDEDPPLSTNSANFSTLISSEKIEEVLMGLRAVGAMLKRSSGKEASLGPSPKDDLYIVSKGKKSSEERAKLYKAYSAAAVEGMHAALSLHGGDRRVLVAASTVFEHASFDACTQAALRQAISAFRHAFCGCPIELCDVGATASAWRKIAFSDYVDSTNGEMVLKELVKECSKAVERRGVKASCEWIRMAVISSVVHITSWDKFLSAMLTAMDSDNTLQILGTTAVCFNAVLWAVAADTRDGTETVRPMLSTFIPMCLDSVSKHLEGDQCIFELIVIVSDLAVLPACELGSATLERLVSVTVKAAGRLSSDLKRLSVQQKECGRIVHSSTDSIAWEQYISARAASAATEQMCTKVVASASRLFLLQRGPMSASAPLLSLWPSVPKTAGDQLKMLFHALRERAGGSGFELEKIILEAAISTTNAAEPMDMASLSQIGAKLSSVHFAVTDKHYSACVQMVSYALEHCLEEPLWLHAAVMYCAKLRQTDAMSAYLKAQQIHGGLSDNVHYATFLYTIAKAAKVTDIKAPLRLKRGREEARDDIQADPDLEGVVSQGGLPVTGKGAGRAATRATTSSGWRVASTPNLDERTLVATQEWE